MAPSSSGKVYIALLHHPVYDRHRRVVTTAVTNLDVHDLARSARTYGLTGFFLVTPLAAQRQMVSRIRRHWVEGEGDWVHEKRREALVNLRIAADLKEACQAILEETGLWPFVVATGASSASWSPASIAHGCLALGGPLLIVFGTGWGLAPPIQEQVDLWLKPIMKGASYNHLSVRGAAAIVLDRLFGDRLDGWEV